MGDLTKTRTVLTRTGFAGTRPHYSNAEDTRDAGQTSTEITLNADVYREMGSPKTITVTVRPGDRLN